MDLDEAMVQPSPDEQRMVGIAEVETARVRGRATSACCGLEQPACAASRP